VNCATRNCAAGCSTNLSFYSSGLELGHGGQGDLGGGKLFWLDVGPSGDFSVCRVNRRPDVLLALFGSICIYTFTAHVVAFFFSLGSFFLRRGA